MICPKCKNKGFKKSEDVPTPNKTYTTEHIGSMIYRRRVCLLCGYKWVTKEEFYREVEAQNQTKLELK